MPEGPEIRRMVDDIERTVGATEARSVFFSFDRFKPFERALSGRRVGAIQARGKAVLVFFAARGDDGLWCVYSHNQLYGQWRIGRADHEPATGRQLRFAILGDTRAARLYSASDIRVVQPDALSEIPYLARLGPDPLNDDTVDNVVLDCLLDDKRFAGRALGGLLLDQHFIAGIGNYLRSEILFEAGLHPARKPRSLTEDERAGLIEAVQMLIKRAYRLKGITNDPERAERLKKQGKHFGARRHMVFGRGGQACTTCGGPIDNTPVASRRLYLCPNCQPACCRLARRRAKRQHALVDKREHEIGRQACGYETREHPETVPPGQAEAHQHDGEGGRGSGKRNDLERHHADTEHDTGQADQARGYALDEHRQARTHQPIDTPRPGR